MNSSIVYTIKRIAKRNGYVVSHVYDLKGDKFCDCLEDEDTLIPNGIYEAVPSHSFIHNRLVLLLRDVPEHTNVLVRPGLTRKDSKGCLLFGQNKNVGEVWYSSYVLDQFLINVIDTFGNFGTTQLKLKIVDDFL